MRNLKKVFALVVAFSMMLSVVAFANYADVDKDASYAGAVELLSALEIFEGDDLGNFNPDNTITRAEVAAVVCRALGLENSANGAKGPTSFTDVAADHWASGYINLASQNGIINGYGDGTFGPEDKVTYEQIVKMLVCALGFEPMAATKGGYPTGYLVVASNYKITSGVTASTEAPRSTVAQLVYNALSTPKMDQTSFGSDEKFEVLDGKNDRDYATLLTDMDVYIATGVVGEKDSDEIDFKLTVNSDDYEFGMYGEKKSEYTVVADSNNEITLKINGSNIENYQHQNVDVYVSKDSKKDYNVVAIVPSNLGETVTILSDDIKNIVTNSGAITGLEYYPDADSNKTKTIKFDSDFGMFFNKQDELDGVDDVVAITDILESDDVELVLVENNGDSKYDSIVATKYVSGRVDSVDADKDKIDIGGTVVTFDFDDDDKTVVLVNKDGKDITLADFAEDDVVAVVSDSTNIDNFKNFSKYIKVINLGDNSVTGTVSETSTKNSKPYVTIDGKDYEDGYGLSIDDEGTFFVGMTGKIIDFDGSAASKNYAYLLEAAKSNGTFTNGWEAKLLTEKDGVVTYTLTTTGESNLESVIKAITNETTAADYKWDDHTANTNNTNRLVTFKTNAKGEIKSIALANGGFSAFTKNSDGEYKANTQKLGGKTLEDDVVIFNVDNTDVDNVYATDINHLVDEADYTGFVFKNSDGEYSVVVLTEDGNKYSEEAGLAIVTGTSSTKDADGQDITKVSYVQTGVEGQVTFNDDDSKKDAGSVEYASLSKGDAFVFSANSANVVTNYVVLGTIQSNNIIKMDAAAKTYLETNMKDTKFYFGYINNTKKEGTSKYETLDIKGGNTGAGYTASVAKNDDTSKYTYNNANSRNVVITNGDFMDEDVYYKEDNKVSYVLITEYDGDIIDIYSFNDRQTDLTIGAPAQQAAATEITEVIAPVVDEVVAPVEDVNIVPVVID